MAGRLPHVTVWRLTLHQRAFSDTAWSDTLICDLIGARSRRLEFNLNKSAQLTFTMDARSPTAALIDEMQHEVIAWRTPGTGQGLSVPLFRGTVSQSEDQLTEQGHTVNFTCHDFIGMLNRRWLTAGLSIGSVLSPIGQDEMVRQLVVAATTGLQTSGGTALMPGSYLPINLRQVNPDGSTRSNQGTPRVRAYLPQQNVGEAIDNLAHVIGGFDYEALPSWRFGGFGSPTYDWLRIYFPQQGITRADPVLEYGGAVATVTRAVNSADYANYWRVIGAAPPDVPDAPPMWAEAVNADANDVGRIPIGVWMGADAAADVSIQSTLDEKAAGNLNLSGVLVPSYTLGLTPGVWGGFRNNGYCNMGDNVPLVINSGRLHVNTSVRIVGIAYEVTDEGDENVSLTVGRPLTSLADMLTATAADVNALARR